MKILRVSFKNLNSLRGDAPHEVDFENGPLRGVSLFAITGPTGAGKSTLLDAITLALYGRAARYGEEPNPEDMMSRHCGECHAAVDFVVAAGRYRAEWHLHRARKRPDGKIQLPRRYLYDEQNVPLTQGIRGADELIERVVGLDYGRFLRSVMLAQGEFSRFLKANASERAALLECLTGTEIYSELGTLAHEEGTRRQAELAGREQVLEAITLFSDDERRQRAAALAKSDAEAERARVERDARLEGLNRARELAQALAEERDLWRRREELVTRQRALDPEMARLQTHRRTLSFADALTRLDAAVDAARSQEARLATAEATRVRVIEAHRRTLAGAAAFGAALVAAQRVRVDGLLGQVGDHEARRAELADWLAAHARDGMELETALPGLIGALNDLAHRRAGLDAARMRVGTLDEETARQDRAVETARQGAEAAGRVLADRAAEKAAADAAVRGWLAGDTVGGRQAEADGLQRRIADLENLAARSRQRAEREKRLAADRVEFEAENDALAGATAEAAALEDKRRAAEADRILRQDHLMQSRAWQSYELQRAKLQPGAECPLCGAREHPFTHGHAPNVSPTQIEAALAATVVRLTELDESLRLVRAAHTRAETRRAAAGEAMRTGGEELAAMTDEIARRAAASGLPDGAIATCEGALVRAIARQAVVRDESARFAEAEKAANACEIAHLGAAHAGQTAAAAATAAGQRRGELQTQAAGAKDTLRRVGDELAAAVAAVTGILSPFGHAVPVAGDETAAGQALGERQRFYRAQDQARQDAEAALTAVRHEARSGHEILAELTRRTAELRAEAEPSIAAEEPPAAWRGIDDAVSAVQVCRDEARSAEAETARGRQALTEAWAKAQEMTDGLTAGLAAEGFDGLAGLRAGRLDEADATRLDGLEKELAGTANQLHGSLETTRRHVAALRAAGAREDVPVDGLKTQHAAAELVHQECLKDAVRRQTELAQDDANRQRHAAATTELAAEHGRLEVWRRLQALIGSHDGARFQRFAQGISLDLLVRRANGHLRRLNHRYALSRRAGVELDLDIVDHDQAGVTRPLASLSGGESFLASLALALGLADLAGRNVRIESLFIDEGFGTLDADSLDLAIEALDGLRRDRKTVGVISHVELLKERIPTQIVLEKGAGGISRLSVRA